MDRWLIIVSRARRNVFRNLRERESSDVHVILDRRKTPRPTARVSDRWQTTMERDGYIIVAPTP